MTEAIVWSAAALVFYTYAGCPLLVALSARLRDFQPGYERT
jgi:hypothetical protein